MRRIRPIIMLCIPLLVCTALWGTVSWTRARALPSGHGAVRTVATRFTPSRNGFPFINHAGAPANTPLGRLLPGICGGMSYAAIDFFAANSLPPASGANTFILGRDVGSILGNAASFVVWTLAPDTARGPGPGLSDVTRDIELPELTRRLTQGPVPLGLVKANALAQMPKNHQVVAYGLKVSGELVTVRIYDPNHPGCDENILTVDMAGSGYVTQYCRGAVVDRWRGFFLEDYTPARPPA